MTNMMMTGRRSTTKIFDGYCHNTFNDNSEDVGGSSGDNDQHDDDGEEEEDDEDVRWLLS